MGQFEELNKKWLRGLKDAQERAKFRDAEIASLKRRLAEEKQVDDARKRPISQTDKIHLAQVARDIARNERELRRIEDIMQTDIDRYYAEGLDKKYLELTSP